MPALRCVGKTKVGRPEELDAGRSASDPRRACGGKRPSDLAPGAYVFALVVGNGRLIWLLGRTFSRLWWETSLGSAPEEYVFALVVGNVRLRPSGGRRRRLKLRLRLSN
jgi:hypothetical protein